MFSCREIDSHKGFLNLLQFNLISVNISAPAFVVRNSDKHHSAITGIDTSLQITVLGSCYIQSVLTQLLIIHGKNILIKERIIKSYRTALGIVVAELNRKLDCIAHLQLSEVKYLTLISVIACLNIILIISDLVNIICDYIDDISARSINRESSIYYRLTCSVCGITYKISDRTVNPRASLLGRSRH